MPATGPGTEYRCWNIFAGKLVLSVGYRSRNNGADITALKQWCQYYNAETMVPILQCRNLSTGVFHSHGTSANITAPESITVSGPVSESWDWSQKHRIGADIMVPKSRHRSPSQSQDRTQKHGTGANITVPIYQHRSLSRSRDRSQNLGTGVNITVPKSRHRSPSRCRYFGIGVHHGHRTGLGNTEPDMKCSRTN